MSKEKQFDTIEVLIRKAAEESLPAFNEAAWDKMSALLDEKEKGRRPIGWLIAAALLMLLGSGLIYILTQKATLNHTAATRPFTQPAGIDHSKTSTQPVVTAAPQNNSLSAKTSTTSPAPQQQQLALQIPVATNRATATTNNANRNTFPNNQLTTTEPVGNNQHTTPTVQFIRRRKLYRKTQVHTSTAEPEDITADNDGNGITSLSTPEKNSTTDTAAMPHNLQAISAIKPPAPQSSSNTDSVAVKNTDTTAMAKTNPVKKPNRKRQFYLVGLAGADMGNVRLLSFNNTKLVPRYGFGIGYQFNNRLSIQTGLYLSNKQYTAGAGDYHPKENSYWYGVDIRKVEAACMIYEIPLTIRYDFISKPATKFYAAVSASSYIMKKEDYHYHYYRYNQYYQKYWQYTGNKHMLSTLSLAAGFERSISPRISMLAEPSVSIPLSGVGDGNVKLFSASLQAGMKWYLR